VRTSTFIAKASAAALALTLLLASCSDDGGDDDATTTAPTRVDTDPQDQASATQAQLSLDDLEGSWTAESAEEGALNGIFDLSPDCEPLQAAFEATDGTLTAETGVRTFTSDKAEVITSGTSVYSDAAGAETFMSALTEGDSSACMSALVALRDEVETEVAVDEALTGGDEAYALTVLSPEATDEPGVTRFIWVRSGRAVAAMTLASFPESPLAEEPLIQAVVDRMSGIG
jgi:hypothetical protein